VLFALSSSRINEEQNHRDEAGLDSHLEKEKCRVVLDLETV